MQTVWTDPSPLMTFTAGIATTVIVLLLVTLIIQKLKNKKNAKQKTFFTPTPYRKDTQKQKLFRFTRGNKALTSEQQEQLFHINKENLNKLKQMWKDEHL